MYSQGFKFLRGAMNIDDPSWPTLVFCVICSPSYEEALWPWFAETGDYDGFHCSDPEHIARFHGVAPQTRNCCELSYHPDMPYAWRKEVVHVEPLSPTSTKLIYVPLSELQSDEEPTDSAPDHPGK